MPKGYDVKGKKLVDETQSCRTLFEKNVDKPNIVCYFN